MGNRHALQHYGSGLFLDCNGNNNNANLVISGFKNGRDQWWIIYEKPSGRYRIKADYHPRRRVMVMENGSVILMYPGKAQEWIIEETGDKETFRIKCPYGYLTGPPQAGPVYVCNEEQPTKLTLWRLLPKNSIDIGPPPTPEWPLSPTSQTNTASSFKCQCSSPHGSFVTNKSFGSNGIRVDAPSIDGSDGKSTDEAGVPNTSMLSSTVQWVSSFVTYPISLLGGPLTPRTENGARNSPVEQPKMSSSAPVRSSVELMQRPPDKNERITVVKSMVESNIRPPSTTVYEPGKVNVFTIVEGMEQTETLEFTVHKEVVNLKRKEITYKFGTPVSTGYKDMGSYKPRQEPYQFTFPKQEVPRGFMVRGKYTMQTEYIDDTGLCCPPFSSSFTIVKE